MNGTNMRRQPGKKQRNRSSEPAWSRPNGAHLCDARHMTATDGIEIRFMRLPVFAW
jgi:hypothetical protein